MQTDAETLPKADIHDTAMAALARSVADHLGPIMVEQLRVDLALGDDAVFTVAEAGRILRRSPASLTAWRASGVGPRVVKLSPRDFGYRLGDLRDYVRAAEKFFPEAQDAESTK
jgi:hypothetical protein